MHNHREPYVGEGIDGALRSAQIDEEEAGTYPTGSAERENRIRSADRWRLQARELELGRPLEPPSPPSLHDAGRALLERKRAAGVLDAGAIDEPDLRLLWSGLELDVDEVREAIAMIVEHLADRADEPTLALGGVVSAVFTEGLAAGILLERMRAAHDARTAPRPTSDPRTLGGME